MVRASAHAAVKAGEMTLKLGIIVHCPSPHQKVMLDQLYSVPDTDVIVGYAYPNSPNRDWGTHVAAGRTVFVPAVRGLSGGKKLREWVASLDRDVWVLTSAFTYRRSQALGTAFEQLGLPWVYGGEPPRPRSGPTAVVRDWMLQRLLSRCRGVIASGKEPARRYRDLLGDDRPVTSVPYFIPLDEWLALPLVSPPAAGETIRFLTLAQLIHRKGIDLLIEACRRLQPGGWRLDVYGEGTERADLQKAIDVASLPITLHRPLPFAERMNAFRGAHCFAFSSRWDGWGMAPVEALAAGLPVIASDQTMSAYDFIEEGKNGWIVPCDPAAIALAMQRVIDQPAALPTLSRAARDSVGGYDPAAGAREVVRFCRDIVGRE
jgi:glycosyltransferase involved in cell wall biosynthesis